MIAAFVGDECDSDQKEYDDKDHALFVGREFENSEKAFHLSLRCAWRLHYRICHVERSETPLACLRVLVSSHLIRDSSPATAGSE